jgi:N-acetylneuraminate lyase
MPRPLTGLIAAPHTPFHSDGRLNLGAVSRQAALLDRNGVTGAFICGTTGEGSSLTSAERRRVAERWRTVKPRRLALIVHVGHSSLGESTGFARHAAGIGADAIAAIAPGSFRPSRLEELVEYCAVIAAAAPQTPFYYYHMPAMSGVDFPAGEFLGLAAGRIPSLAGIKFTHEDLMDFANALNFGNRRYNLLFGRDEILLAGLALGAEGAVGSTYNFAAPLYRRVLRAFRAGDLAAAREAQRRAIAMIEQLNRYGGLAAGKTVMKFLGADCGPVRLPLRALAPEDEASLRAGLDAIGFFRYASRL